MSKFRTVVVIVMIMLAALNRWPMVAMAQEEPQSVGQGADYEMPISNEEFVTLAALVFAEAGNQDYVGKKLVVDVVLNRVDDPRFPNTIMGVIYQKGQFGPVANGSLKRAFNQVTEECYEAVIDELVNRVDDEIIYFNTGGYQWGTPCYKYGAHYFSK